MAKQMLIDAAYPEETRVAVVEDGRLLAFDFDASYGRQISGNIYLAQIVRVEPALQAAFVDFGEDRHGFLALSEIHPDYFQVPESDRSPSDDPDNGLTDLDGAEAGPPPRAGKSRHGRPESDDESEPEGESGDSFEDEDHRKTRNQRRKANRRRRIEEVIRNRQIVLVQAYKEPRGNKGAALTTYLSLAGRYCVLMPNTARGGGISRKIGDVQDRRRLKEIAQDLEVAPGLGVIIRTAGSNRTKAEIKRDYTALLRQWEAIRKTTLNSIAPCLIHEESSLLRRAVRDLYEADVEQILVEGDAAYREAKGYMKLLTPSHAKNVRAYKDEAPIFAQYRVEKQLDTLFDAEVPLPSGGSIVISPTEALTAIDVNSGRSTRERTIEETAVKTNLEAADEIARQLRLRDIAGLIVIDFIDMDVERNRRSVESRLKDRLKSGRARTQIGRISGFGLLEMSRQRLKRSMIEITSTPCPHCSGSGYIRSDSSLALAALRQVEEEARSNHGRFAQLRVSPGTASYLANEKRTTLSQIEERRQVTIRLTVDPGLPPSQTALAWSNEADSTPSAQPERERRQRPDRPDRSERASRRKPGRSRDRARRNADDIPEPTGEDLDDRRSPEAMAQESDAGSPRRRRGRRGGRGRRQWTDSPAAESAPSDYEYDTYPEPPADSDLMTGMETDRPPAVDPSLGGPVESGADIR